MWGGGSCRSLIERERMPFNDKTQETMMRERKASQVVVNEIDECDVK